MDQIGKYKILGELGQGGMGYVYKAHDSVIGRDVAIKVIHRRALSSEDVKKRFYREARSAGRLSHQNITTIYDVGEDKGRPYIVMEYLEGHDLRLALEAGRRVSLLDKLRIAGQICEGLQYAHDQGVIHRDIKPDNIRVLPSGLVKILDFGIARLQDDVQTQTLTAVGTSLGTPRYMSPEQIRGEKLDNRSDIFAFGVVFYELISGQPPFSGDQVTTLIYKILNVDPDPIEIEPDSFRVELQPVLSKCLAKDADDRYKDFDAVLADLRPVLSQTETESVNQPVEPLSETLTRFAYTLPPPPIPPRDSSSGIHAADEEGLSTAIRLRTQKIALRVGIPLLLLIGGLAAGYVLFGRSSVDATRRGLDDTTVAASQESPGTSSTLSDSILAIGVEGEELSEATSEPSPTSDSDPITPRMTERPADAAQKAASTSAVPASGRTKPTSTRADNGVQNVLGGSDDTVSAESGIEEVTTPASAVNTVLDPPEEAPSLQADSTRSRMARSRATLPGSFQTFSLFRNGATLQQQGDLAYAADNFDEATRLFGQANKDFDDAGDASALLDQRVEAWIRTIRSALGDEDQNALAKVSSTYASYFSRLFSAAHDIKSEITTSAFTIDGNGGNLTVTMAISYMNNKNEESTFSRTDQWILQYVDRDWRLQEIIAN